MLAGRWPSRPCGKTRIAMVAPARGDGTAARCPQRYARAGEIAERHESVSSESIRSTRASWSVDGNVFHAHGGNMAREWIERHRAEARSATADTSGPA